MVPVYPIRAKYWSLSWRRQARTKRMPRAAGMHTRSNATAFVVP